MTICGIENKTDFPKISYITALDMYVAVCFAFVLATILEFAFVHYFTKYGTGEPLLYDSSEDEEDSVFEETFEEEQECPDLESNGLDGSHMPKPAKGGNFGRILLAKVCDCLHCITHTKVYYGFKKKDMTGFINSVSQIDKSSRVLFPVTFLIFNVVYWVSYSRWKV